MSVLGRDSEYHFDRFCIDINLKSMRSKMGRGINIRFGCEDEIGLKMRECGFNTVNTVKNMR